MTCKDGKSHFSGLAAGESSSLQQRQKRLQEHGKERRELLSKGTFQVLGNTAKLGSGGLPFPVIFFMLGSKTNASIPTKLLECCSNQLYQRLISAVNQLLPLRLFLCPWKGLSADISKERRVVACHGLVKSLVLGRACFTHLSGCYVQVPCYNPPASVAMGLAHPYCRSEQL